MVNSLQPGQIKFKNYQRLTVIVGLALAFLYALVLTLAIMTGIPPSDLVIPIVALILFWLISVSLVAIGGSVLARRERQGINALFAEPAWETWQYTPEEWRLEYEQQYRGEKRRARASCGYLIVGPIVGAIFPVFGYFIRNSPYASPIMFIGVIVGVAIILLSITQYLVGRTEAQRHYEEAQQIPSPFLIFGQHGVYHQATGFQSLKGLHRVEILAPNSGDAIERAYYAYVNKLYKGGNLSYLRLFRWRRRSRGTITLAIPHRYEANTQQLVERYKTYIKERGRRW